MFEVMLLSRPCLVKQPSSSRWLVTSVPTAVGHVWGAANRAFLALSHVSYIYAFKISRLHMTLPNPGLSYDIPTLLLVTTRGLEHSRSGAGMGL